MKRTILACVALALLSQTVDARGRQGHNIPARDGKVLSLFNVVTFENDPCTSNAKTGSGTSRNGTCFTASECTDKGGTHSGNCAAGFGVCCVFTIENSGDDINQNCSYIRNPGFPSTYSGSDTKFTHTINKCSCEVCFIRLDFEAFTLRGTADTFETTGGECTDTFIATTSSGQNVPTICGQNAGKHMYIETGQSCGDSVTISTSFTGASTTRRWDIKVSQIECNNAMVPPQGCLEYLTTPQGRITSFNWESSGETHLANQDHKICVRNTKGSCCVQYTPCDDPLSYSFNDDTTNMAFQNSMCTLDYIEAQNFSPDCVSRNSNSYQGYNKLCGGFLNTLDKADVNLEAVCDCNPQFALTFHTDGVSEVAGDAMPNTMIVNKGLCFDYQVLNC